VTDGLDDATANVSVSNGPVARRSVSGRARHIHPKRRSGQRRSDSATRRAGTQPL